MKLQAPSSKLQCLLVLLCSAWCSTMLGQEALTLDARTGMILPPKSGLPIMFQSGVGVSAPARTTLGISQTVWIAKRTDDLAGSGVEMDPYNGKTKALLDAILRDATKCPEYAEINFVKPAAGAVYETEGAQDYFVGGVANKGFIPRRGWKMKLNGSTLRLMSLKDVPSGNKYWGTLIADPGMGTNMSDLVLENGTLDCNAQNLSAGTTGGVGYSANGAIITGNNYTIRNIRVINAYGNVANLKEAIALGGGAYQSGGAWVASTGGLIENCTIDGQAPGSDYGGGIVMFASGAPWKASGVVRNNMVRNWTGTSAYGMIGEDIELVGNSTLDSALFLYGDTGTSNRITVRNSTVVSKGNSTGSSINGFAFLNGAGGASFTNFTFDGNVVSVCPMAGDEPTYVTYGSVRAGGAVGANNVHHIVVKNHTVKLDPRSTAPAGYLRSWLFSEAQDVTVEASTYDRSYLPALSFDTTGFKLLEARDRQDTDLVGALRVAATITALPGSAEWTLSSAYTIVSGDRLQYEVYCDEGNPVCAPEGFIYPTTAVDQNGALGTQEISALAKARWYARDFDLTTFAGTATTALILGQYGTQPNGVQNPTGAYINYYRNIRIVSSTGAIRVRYHTPETQITPALATQTNVSGVSLVQNFRAVAPGDLGTMAYEAAGDYPASTEIWNEQTVGDEAFAWTNGKTLARRTVGLTISRAGLLPATASYPDGRVIEYVDSVSSEDNTVVWARSGADTLNGATDQVGILSKGVTRFAKSGTNWQYLLEPKQAALDQLFNISEAQGGQINELIDEVTGTGALVFQTNPVLLYPDSAMAANVIDVAQRRNTKTSASNSYTFTFSATPTSGQRFGLILTNGDATADVITLPANCVSMADEGNPLASFTLPGNAKVALVFDFNGTTYEVLGEPVAVRLKGYTVAGLPSGTVGAIAYVTDATAPTYNSALVGGGSVIIPVFYNGSAWVSH